MQPGENDVHRHVGAKPVGEAPDAIALPHAEALCVAAPRVGREVVDALGVRSTRPVR